MKCTQNSFCQNLEEKSRNFKVGGIKGLVKIVGTDNKVRMLYSTGSRDKGVEIIYCPFCGVKLKEDNVI